MDALDKLKPRLTDVVAGSMLAAAPVFDYMHGGSQAAVFLAAAFILAFLALLEPRSRPDGSDAGFALFAALSWASLLWSKNPNETVAALLPLTAAVVAYVYVPRNQETFRFVAVAAAATLVTVSTFGIYQNFVEFPDLERRIAHDPEIIRTVNEQYPDRADRDMFMIRVKSRTVYATFHSGYANALGGWITMLLPLTIGWVFVAARKRHGLIALVATGAPLWCLFLTRSKGAALTLAALVPIGMIFAGTRPVRRLGIGLLALGAAGLGYLFFATDVFAESAAVRLDYWTAALGMIAERPFSGVGAGLFGGYYHVYKTATGGEVQMAHQSYLQAAAELGVGGLIFLAVFLVRSLGKLARAGTSGLLLEPPPVTSGYFIQGLLAGFFVIVALLKSRGVPAIAFSFGGLWLAAFGVFSAVASVSDMRRLRKYAFLTAAAFFLHALIDWNLYSPQIVITLGVLAGAARDPQPRPASAGRRFVGALALATIATLCFLRVARFTERNTLFAEFQRNFRRAAVVSDDAQRAAAMIVAYRDIVKLSENFPADPEIALAAADAATGLAESAPEFDNHYVDEALQTYERVVAMAPFISRAPECAAALALWKYRIAKTPDALDRYVGLLERSVAAYPTKPGTRLALGWAMLQKRDFKKARAQLNAARTLHRLAYDERNRLSPIELADLESFVKMAESFSDGAGRPPNSPSGK